MWRAFEKAGYAATNKIRPPRAKRKRSKPTTHGRESKRSKAIRAKPKLKKPR
jgi:hypothetical protein